MSRRVRPSHCIRLAARPWQFGRAAAADDESAIPDRILPAGVLRKARTDRARAEVSRRRRRRRNDQDQCSGSASLEPHRRGALDAGGPPGPGRHRAGSGQMNGAPSVRILSGSGGPDGRRGLWRAVSPASSLFHLDRLPRRTVAAPFPKARSPCRAAAVPTASEPRCAAGHPPCPEPVPNSHRVQADAAYGRGPSGPSPWHRQVPSRSENSVLASGSRSSGRIGSRSVRPAPACRHITGVTRRVALRSAVALHRVRSPWFAFIRSLLQRDIVTRGSASTSLAKRCSCKTAQDIDSCRTTPAAQISGTAPRKSSRVPAFYVTAGEGKHVVVLLHGFPSTWWAG